MISFVEKYDSRPFVPRPRPRPTSPCSDKFYLREVKLSLCFKVRQSEKPYVNFINNLWAAFTLIFFRKKIAKPNLNYSIAVRNTFVQKSCT